MNLLKDIQIWVLTLSISIPQSAKIYLSINQEVNKIPTLNFIEQVLYPKVTPYKCKLVGLLEIYDSNVTTQDFDSIDFLYETISVSLSNLKMLSDKQYTFSNEKIASINSFMVFFDDNTDNITKEQINKYVKYFIE